MFLFPKLFITILFLFSVAALASAENASTHQQAVTIAINHADGGKTSSRHVGRLLAVLDEGGCKVSLSDDSSLHSAQLVFDPGPVSVVMKQRPDYQLIARARTLDGELTVRGAIVVHASTGITDLATLRNEWISFVSKESWSGYRLPLQLLQGAGIDETTNAFYFVGNHIGVVSALLHNDVHVAVSAEPLVKRWAEQNNISIVALTAEVETGGWWMQRSVATNLTRDCARAVMKLNDSNQKALPAWIGDFVSPE